MSKTLLIGHHTPSPATRELLEAVRPCRQRSASVLFIHSDRREADGVADINAQQFVSPQPRQQHRHHQGPFAYGPGQIAAFARPR